jgi:hypothetical protein
MDQLPLPSDVKRMDGTTPPAAPEAALVEPPSAKLMVRLFLIPLLIVGAAVGVMWIVGLMAGGEPQTDQILRRLRSAGGERTGNVLVGPGSKQRYLDAAALAEQMKTPGRMTEAYRLRLTDELIDIIRKHTHSGEGEIRQFLLLALGRTWQIDPSQGPIDTPQAAEARQRAVQALLESARSTDLPERKAAILAIAYMAGSEQVRAAIEPLVEILADSGQDLDVRLAAATVLGPIGDRHDSRVIDALTQAMRETDPRYAELVWSAALSLAQLGQMQVSDTILMLLDREELAKLRVYDRETDPQNPVFRPLREQEVLRYLVNTVIGASKLDEPRVQARLRELSQSDPSARVRAAAMDVLGSPARTSGPEREP